jgi:hypothetical protein
MKVSTEIDNNFGYEKITQLVDNIPLNNTKTSLFWLWASLMKVIPDEGWRLSLMKVITDEGYTWWRLSLMKVIPDEGYTWWRLSLMKVIPDEGYPRNVSCALHLISTFVLRSKSITDLKLCLNELIYSLLPY